MADITKVHELHSQGFNCAQVVAYFCCDFNGADREAALAAMGGFGGGLRCGEVCARFRVGFIRSGSIVPTQTAAIRKQKAKSRR